MRSGERGRCQVLSGMRENDAPAFISSRIPEHAATAATGLVESRSPGTPLAGRGFSLVRGESGPPFLLRPFWEQTEAPPSSQVARQQFPPAGERVHLEPLVAPGDVPALLR